MRGRGSLKKERACALHGMHQENGVGVLRCLSRGIEERASLISRRGDAVDVYSECFVVINRLPPSAYLLCSSHPQIFNNITTGFADTSAFVRELTLKSMLLLAPKVG